LDALVYQHRIDEIPILVPFEPIDHIHCSSHVDILISYLCQCKNTLTYLVFCFESINEEQSALHQWFNQITSQSSKILLELMKDNLPL